MSTRGEHIEDVGKEVRVCVYMSYLWEILRVPATLPCHPARASKIHRDCVRRNRDRNQCQVGLSLENHFSGVAAIDSCTVRSVHPSPRRSCANFTFKCDGNAAQHPCVNISLQLVFFFKAQLPLKMKRRGNVSPPKTIKADASFVQKLPNYGSKFA